MRNCFIGLSIVLFAANATAHSLNLFVHEEGGAAKGSAYFTGGIPAKNIEVVVLDSEDKTLGNIQTDAEGNFVYSGPRPGGVVRFVVSTPDGHRAESKLQSAAGDVSTEPASSPVATTPETTSDARQLGAIQEAIDQLEKRLWLRDVIGGIGYIFGLAGLWALWKSRSGGARH